MFASFVIQANLMKSVEFFCKPLYVEVRIVREHNYGKFKGPLMRS